MKMKKGLILALSIAASMLFTCISNAEDKEFIDVTVTSEAELFDAPITFKSNNISEINISNLNKMRDDFIRSNYNIYLEKLETDASSFEEYYNEMLNSPYGISKFFEEKYGNLNDEDLLKKEITFINFMNQNDICFINVQGFIPNYYNTYEGLIFRKKHNKQNLIKQTKQMSENELKELFQFYYENIIEYLNNADSDVDLIFQIVYPQGIDNLDDEFEKQIREKYEKKLLITNLKKLTKIEMIITKNRIFFQLS